MKKRHSTKPAELLALPYTYVRLDESEFDAADRKRLGFRTCYPFCVYFSSARDRERFAAAVKRAIKKRGLFITNHLDKE